MLMILEVVDGGRDFRIRLSIKMKHLQTLEMKSVMLQLAAADEKASARVREEEEQRYRAATDAAMREADISPCSPNAPWCARGILADLTPTIQTLCLWSKANGRPMGAAASFGTVASPLATMSV